MESNIIGNSKARQELQPSGSLGWQNETQPISISPSTPRYRALLCTDINSDSPSSTIPSLQSISPNSFMRTYSPIFQATTPNVSSVSNLQQSSLLSNESGSCSRYIDDMTPLVLPLPKSGSVANGNHWSKEDMDKIVCKDLAKDALKLNDTMVYLEGPMIYTCGECRTHLTSHDEIISKSFHGRHGRAYLFDHCVNITTGPIEDRRLITGLHSVCDIFCKRCKTLIGWTYARAYEPSQRYKEGKFIIEKINLHMEESDYYDVNHPAGERRDKWKIRSMSWANENQGLKVVHGSLVTPTSVFGMSHRHNLNDGFEINEKPLPNG